MGFLRLRQIELVRRAQLTVPLASKRRSHGRSAGQHLQGWVEAAVVSDDPHGRGDADEAWPLARPQQCE